MTYCICEETMWWRITILTCLLTDDEVGDTEVVSEDELPPPPSKEKVDGAEEVSDEELPAGPKLETPPEGKLGPIGHKEISEKIKPETQHLIGQNSFLV